MERYDICVIGGGPAGYAAVMRALDFNMKVLLIEKNKIGGAGLYDGALSSKTLWELSKDVYTARERLTKYSKCKDFDLDFSEVKRELHAAIAQRKEQLEYHLTALQKEGYSEKLFIKNGEAKLRTNHEVSIKHPSDEVETIYAEHIVLATGSRPRKLPHIPVDEKIIVTSDGIHHFDELPESLVVLGAGVIGCEYATIFSGFGKTKVNLIDKADHILPFEDDDVSGIVEENFEKDGINIHRNSWLERMEIVDGHVEYELSYANGEKEVFKVEKALMAVGRIPNSDNLGLEEVGVELTARGSIVNTDAQTTVPNIYAVGDLTADMNLVNVGELEGRHAIERIANKDDKPLSYDNISSIMFLKPIVAGVGMNEKQARANGISYQVVSINYSMIPRAIAMRNSDGFFKILVSNNKEMKVLGMRAVGAQASSAIQAVALLIAQGKSVSELAELIHPHPSLIEGIQECCRMLLGKSIFKPYVFKDMKYEGYMEGEYSSMSATSEDLRNIDFEHKSKK